MRKARWSDLKQIVYLERQVFPASLRWEPSDLRVKIQQGRVMVATEPRPAGNHLVVGYICSRVRDGAGYIDSVGVLHSHRFKGVGSGLVSAALKAMWNAKVDGCELDCDVDLIPFYHKFGFTVRGYYIYGFGSKLKARVVMAVERDLG